MTPTDTPQALSADTPESVASAIRPHDLTPDDGAVMIRASLLRRAADLIRAQAAEVARLKARCTKFVEAMGCALWSAIADRERAEAAEARATVVEAALTAERAQVQAMRVALENASRFVRAFAADETDEEIYASACACEEQIDAALSTAPAEQPGPADAPSLLAAWWLDGASFDQRLLAAGLVKAIAYDLTEAGKAAINHHVATRSAGLLPATEGEGRDNG